MKLDLEALRKKWVVLADDSAVHLDGSARVEMIALIDELVETQAALANARAAAFEEARLGWSGWADSLDQSGDFGEWLGNQAHLPPSVVCVPVETLEQAKKALRTVYEWASEAMIPHDLWRHFLHADADGVVMIRAALAALNAEKQR